MTPPVALTIAGSDSCAGAGVQADLKTFAALGVFGTSALTALTAQNTVAVRDRRVVSAEFVDAQISAVLDDLPVAAVKTGLLATAAVVEVVAERATRGELPNLVVDPVLVASTGARLLDLDAERAYLECLFPRALVVTPNSREAAALVGRDPDDAGDPATMARQLAEHGARVVVLTGGDGSGDEAVDVVLADGQLHELRAPWVTTRNVHGTGCTFASAIAARLAHGDEPLRAIEYAKRYVIAALRASAGWRLGSGHGPVDHFVEASRETLVLHTREPGRDRAERAPSAPTVEPDPGHTGGGS